ncbi:hypothetical protein [Planomicrobium okeanokoites]|uniref:hypothetical protein n=1 Tax=Planomicrobium okeanokoites TaxID=244 RepID=UPI002491A271|nr:hypothetical protein [Planomicrobium okeanokoites]
MKNRVYKPEKIIARKVLRDIGIIFKDSAYDEKSLEKMSDEECDKELTEIYKAE